MSPIPDHETAPFENLDLMAPSSSATMMKRSPTMIRANSPSNIADKRTPKDPTVSAVMQHLRRIGIQLLAFDFDQTIIDIHTGGNWDGSAEELIPHIRPIMYQLIQAAVATKTTVADGSSMEVAIVTFSGQTDLIENVMDHIVGGAPGAKRNIPVYGAYCCSQYHGPGSTDGKQAHISRTIQELSRVAGTKFQKSTTVLIDDDRNNVKYAELDSTRAVWFHPEEPGLLLLQELLRLTPL
ncbi:MAG: hypothetical protein SGBAC_005443 [Bacillariaceae sp.]